MRTAILAAAALLLAACGAERPVMQPWEFGAIGNPRALELGAYVQGFIDGQKACRSAVPEQMLAPQHGGYRL